MIYKNITNPYLEDITNVSCFTENMVIFQQEGTPGCGATAAAGIPEEHSM